MSTSSAPATRQTDPSKEALNAAMHSFTGRAAVERCIRAHGGEPPEDRIERGRAHLEAHGATFPEGGGVRWPVPQSPSLSTLFGGRPRWTGPLDAAVSQREDAARGVSRVARWQTQDEATAWLRCPDRRTTHILDGDPAVEHARAHGTDGELTPCPSCPGPALVRTTGAADRG